MLVVFLELCALMRGNRVFQRQCVQAEFVAQTRDGLAVRRLEFDPDEAIRLADVIADIVECDRFGLGLGVAEEQAVDDGLRRRGGSDRNSSRNAACVPPRRTGCAGARAALGIPGLHGTLAAHNK
jgi:hypothetical protein